MGRAGQALAGGLGGHRPAKGHPQRVAKAMASAKGAGGRFAAGSRRPPRSIRALWRFSLLLGAKGLMRAGQSFFSFDPVRFGPQSLELDDTGPGHRVLWVAI